MTSRPLPFTERAFFDLFGAYNRAFWLVIAGFWIVNAGYGAAPA